MNLAEALDRNVMPAGPGPGYPGGLPQRSPDGRDVVTHVWAALAEGSAPPRAVFTGAAPVVPGLSVATGADVAAIVVGDPTPFGEVALLPLNGGRRGQWIDSHIRSRSRQIHPHVGGRTDKCLAEMGSPW